jgi:hypothetical protein
MPVCLAQTKVELIRLIGMSDNRLSTALCSYLLYRAELYSVM